jgi:hypothetical protein
LTRTTTANAAKVDIFNPQPTRGAAGPQSVFPRSASPRARARFIHSPRAGRHRARSAGVRQDRLDTCPRRSLTFLFSQADPYHRWRPESRRLSAPATQAQLASQPGSTSLEARRIIRATQRPVLD